MLASRVLYGYGALIMLSGCPVISKERLDRLLYDTANDTGHDTGDDTGDDTGQEQPADDEALGVEVDWSSSGVTLSLINGEGAYELGIAETDPASPAPWTGEDCMYGYTTGAGTTYLYCHPLSSTGGSFLTLTEWDDFASDFDEGTHTLFSVDDDHLTYLIFSDVSGECWVGGDDPSYYEAMDCGSLDLF